jgi:hypothetical protein
MKSIKFIVLFILFSCSEPKYDLIEQEIIDGKISHTEEGRPGSYGIPARLPKIWVQTSKETRELQIPFAYENRWKTGDSCLLIIEKYRVNEK